MTRCALLLVAFSPLLSYAFPDTLPVVAWSSRSNHALDILPTTKAVDSESLLRSILFNDVICSHDAVVIVEQPGLHASDLRMLHPNSALVHALDSAPSSRQFPHVRRANSPVDLASIALSVSSQCQSRVAYITLGEDDIGSLDSEKHVINMKMPHLTGTAASRKSAMVDHEYLLSNELATLSSVFPDHLVIYTSSAPAFHYKRQLSVDVAPSSNATLAQGGILKRYQLLTPGLITTLLVAIFVLLPTIMLGFNALSSIQSPLRVEAPKGFNAQERKNQ